MRRRVAWACVILVAAPEAVGAVGGFRHAPGWIEGLVEALLLGSLFVLGSTLVYGAWLGAIAMPVVAAVARSPSAVEPVGVLVILLETGIIYGAFIAAGAAARGVGELTWRRPRPSRTAVGRSPGRVALAVAVAVAAALAFKAMILDNLALDPAVAIGGLVLVAALVLYAIAAQGAREEPT